MAVYATYIIWYMKSFTYQFGYMGSNCYLLTDDSGKYGVVIDPSVPVQTVLEGQDPDLVITHILITHAHFDHLYYYEEWKQKTQALSAIHCNEAFALANPENNLSTMIRRPQQYPSADLLLKEGDRIPLGDESLVVLFTPGHTGGSACFLIGERLYSGDTLFSEGSVGRTDFPTGDGQALGASIQKLLQLPPKTLILPGHGGSSTVLEERLYHL